ncbi:MAG: hypothetical protein SGJ27_23965 [Candidatus Melainabacteria bacterium]|nr:hypothetical protein [Candidatus Melainabacteria bacterium]
MSKSTINWFNSLVFLSSVLGATVVTPPALAETCMTDSLMMVYEPVVGTKPRTKKSNNKKSVVVKSLTPETTASSAAQQLSQVDDEAANQKQTDSLIGAQISHATQTSHTAVAGR